MVSISFLWLITSSIYAQDLSSIAPYPDPKENEVRNVIWLKKFRNEENYKIEIISFKKGVRDCNQTSYQTTLSRNTLEGWGYSYFTINNLDEINPVSTMLPCASPEIYLADIPVALTGSESMLRYNSKLPLVIYAPKDIQVKVKIWKFKSIKSATDSNS